MKKIIPFNDLSRLSNKIKNKSIVKIRKIINSGTFISGEEVEKFEKEFSRYIGCKFSIGVASGTDALKISYQALGLREGDEVIVPAMSFFATISPLLQMGIKPILVDVDEKGLIDCSLIEERITSRTKAIIVVHLYGNICNMEEIAKIAKANNLYIIEDACQAHGSSYKGRKAGSFGTIAAFSFYPSKNLGAFGDGGAITTSNKNLAIKSKILGDHGQARKYYHEFLGYNSRLDSIHAAVLRIKLKLLEKDNKRRRAIAKIYEKDFSLLPINLIEDRMGYVPNFHLYVVKTKQRDKLKIYLKEKGINSSIHYPIPLHLHEAVSFLNYKKNDFSVAEQLAKESLSLPLFPEMTNKEVDFVIKSVKDFFLNQTFHKKQRNYNK